MQITNSMPFRMEILPVAFLQHVEWNSLPDLRLHIVRAGACWFKNRKINPGSPNKQASCICSFKIISLKKQKARPGIRQSSILVPYHVNKERPATRENTGPRSSYVGLAIRSSWVPQTLQVLSFCMALSKEIIPFSGL